MSLPGLSLGTTPASTHQSITTEPTPKGPSKPPRTQTLAAKTEWRFEAPFTTPSNTPPPYTLRLTAGNAELFGAELAPNITYDLSGLKAALFTWQGCQFEITGDAESEYAGAETEYAIEWLNVHGMLECARESAPSGPDGGGPRVLIVGPKPAGNRVWRAVWPLGRYGSDEPRRQ